jgi:Zn-dependent protease with chaperone function
LLPAVVIVLYLPVLGWVFTGVILLIAFHRSAPSVVLRLAATFLALWAVLATTILVWVLDNGGWAAVVRLVRQPLILFDPRWLGLWLVGAAGAFIVLTIAFLLNQLVGRGFLHLLHPTPLPWPHRLPRPSERTSLLRYASSRPEAFSFTLLSLAGAGRTFPHRHEIILLSDGLLERLAPEEVEAAVGHEVGHIRGLDGRYLTFFRTFARLMRWDPLLAYLASSLTRREEYRADDEAVRMTRRPLALARALFKTAASPEAGSALPFGVRAFLGGGGSSMRFDVQRRIERLIALAESGEFDPPEGP